MGLLLWMNITWSVLYYDYGYSLSPKPYIIQLGANYYEEEFPIVSLAQTWINPDVGFTIGNNWTYPITVNFTITLYY